MSIGNRMAAYAYYGITTPEDERAASELESEASMKDHKLTAALGHIVKASTERLVHFQHVNCPEQPGGSWWSIGDAPDRPYWFCPWCGKRLVKAGQRETVQLTDTPGQRED